MTDADREKAQAQAERILHWLRGDLDAARFCDQLFFLTQVWDDLVDRDKDVAPDDVCRAFWLALVELPANPFYRRHMADLAPALRSFICDWQDANALERGTAHEKTLAFVLRDTVGGMVSQCAYLVGGYEWQRLVSPDIRRMIHDETLQHYVRGLP